MRLVAALFMLVLPLALGAQGQLPAWQKGELDLHFISTNRGDAMLAVFPDGTTMLTDAGDIPADLPAVPDSSKSAGEWIADYIRQFCPGIKKLDYALVTHYHNDHYGDFTPGRPVARKGGYMLTGITEVGTLVPFAKLIDRGDVRLSSAEGDFGQYLRFVEYQSGRGMVRERAQVGSRTQIREVHSATPGFEVRVLFSDGEIASRTADSVAYRRYGPSDQTSENNLSVGYVISYGNFKFYTGGDISGCNFVGETDHSSMESLVAPLVGQVDVATLNHHGNWDTQNVDFVRTLAPRVWIGQLWGSGHPGELVLRRITHPDVYPGERDFYATVMHPYAQAFHKVRSPKYSKNIKSLQGHVVIRVAPGGNSYDIYVLDDSITARTVKTVTHYISR